MLAVMRAVICAVLSFIFPGLGDGFVRRYRSMALWLVAPFAVCVVSALSIWQAAPRKVRAVAGRLHQLQPRTGVG